jgi:hypothetical protein
MTPTECRTLLDLYTSSHALLHARTYSDSALRVLLEAGLVKPPHGPSEQWTLTNKGQAYVAAFLSTPLPEEAFLDAQGEVISATAPMHSLSGTIKFRRPLHIDIRKSHEES